MSYPANKQTQGSENSTVSQTSGCNNISDNLNATAKHTKTRKSFCTVTWVTVYCSRQIVPLLFQDWLQLSASFSRGQPSPPPRAAG